MSGHVPPWVSRWPRSSRIDSASLKAIPIVRIPESECRDDLIQSLTSSNERVRANAARVLAKFGARKAAEEVALLLNEERDQEVRGCLIEALGHIGDRSRAEFLVRTMRSEPALKAACRKALAQLAGKDLGDDDGKWETWVKEQGR